MRIIFTFAGGPMDGKTVVGESGDQGEADRYYILTHHGKPKQRFRTASDYAIDTLAKEEPREDEPHHFQQHIYEVADRLEKHQEVLVRAEYVQKTSS